MAQVGKVIGLKFNVNSEYAHAIWGVNFWMTRAMMESNKKEAGYFLDAAKEHHANAIGFASRN